MTTLTVSLDSIPYSKVGVRFLANGLFACRKQLSTWVMGPILHSGFAGSCSDDVIDSIDLTIDYEPSYLSSALNRNPLVSLFKVQNQRLVISPAVRARLEIFNSIGQEMFSIVIDGDTNLSSEIADLPTGCYFARLGDQVAKFIVPPR